ncbi:guanosine-5'-triphosphate,3'-diphosphate diphosphatase [Pseudoalteromonas sp. SSDWG2]|uniref:guanosine-5'-triphosphate,3'-diphosphate diphosphatase n=1 Tax=Pseudoalteromonas sp. SSDWG2 TaxID=3139391 RepID=UPI003BA8A106
MNSSLQDDLYAVIDLGSNSFHMLIAKTVAGSLQTIGRVKRKVRLAAGLNEQMQLSPRAMQRGWECLALFAERLQDIPPHQVKIVATATLRLAKNADVFRERAEQILGHPVHVISGEEEAKTIYKGVAHTSACSGKQLVIDIGGASTEIVIGEGHQAIHYTSLHMGCVTYLESFFKDGLLSEANYTQAINAAKQTIAPIVAQYTQTGWEYAAGASGTVQAIQEIMVAQRQDETLTLDKLLDIKSLTTQYASIDDLQLPGLSEERRLVFVSGLAILIAIFESLDVKSMGLAGGALREGVLYTMIPELQRKDIRQRTIESFIARYHIDSRQGERVACIANLLLSQLAPQWHVSDTDSALLKCAAMLHEVGLLIEYKKYPKHGAYILKNTDMPGFTRQQHKLIAQLVHYHKGDISAGAFDSLGAHQQLATRLVKILRLAVTLSMRRQNDVLPELDIKETNGELTLNIDKQWLEAHPLMFNELEQESIYHRNAGWKLTICK